MKQNRLFSKLFALAVTAVTLFTTQPMTKVVADEVEDERLSQLYVGEVKMFYGRDEAEARELCEAEGYIFCPENLKQDHKGTICGAYLGYKTTDDPGDAVTDLTLLDLKDSHFEDMSYEEYLDKFIDQYADDASKCMVLVNEFRRAYKAGSEAALAVYDSLNMFYMKADMFEPSSRMRESLQVFTKGYEVKTSSDYLGDYLLNECDMTFFERYFQRGNADVLGAIINILAGAATDYGQRDTTWLDEAKSSEIPYMLATGDSAKISELHGWYQDSAKKLISEIRSFADTYNEAKPLYDTYGQTFGYGQSEELTDDDSFDELMQASPDCRLPEYVSAMELFALLDSIPYQQAGETIVTYAARFAEAAEEDAESENDEASEDLETAEDDEIVPATVLDPAIVTECTENKSLAQYFLELAADPNLEAHPETVYPLVGGMTSAQRTVLDCLGLRRLIDLLFPVEGYKATRESTIREAEEKLKAEGIEEGRVYVWIGVDQSLLSKRVAETSTLKEKELAGSVLLDSQNAAERAQSGTLHQILLIVDFSTMAVSGAIMIISALLPTSLWAAGQSLLAWASLAISWGASAVAGVLGTLGVMLCALYVVSIIALVVSICYMVYSFLDMLGVFDDVESIDYDDIPEILFHVRSNSSGDYRVRYDVVQSNMSAFGEKYIKSLDKGYMLTWDFRLSSLLRNSTDMAELGCYQAEFDRWMTLYYTKAPAAGQPIPVENGKSFIRTQQNNYQAPEGYRGVALANANIAADINQPKISGKKGTPLYLFIPGKSSAMGSATVVDSGVYVTDVRLSHAEKREDALNQLKKNSFQVIDVNLTPSDDYTFLGYKTGSEAFALRDIRVSSLGTEAVDFGDAHYAMVPAKETTGITPDGLALYVSASASAGSPIVKVSVETKRLELGSGAEPVCLFSGGNAVDFRHEYRDNYKTSQYIPQTKQDEPEDGIYIYFWPKEQYKMSDAVTEPPYVAGFSYFLAPRVTEKSQGDFGTDAEYMQKFAKANGFELLMDGDQPLQMIPGDANRMRGLTGFQTCNGRSEEPNSIFTYMEDGKVKHEDFWSDAIGKLSVEYYALTEPEIPTKQYGSIYGASMYFGVSYTYNPYRAITGVSGLLTPYSEMNSQLIYSGLPTPAGTMQVTNVSIQGNPVTSQGITQGYYNPMNMPISLFNQWDIRQKYDLPWMTKEETEFLTHSLLVNGPADKRLPIRRDEIMFVSHENPGEYKDYVPVCDLRTPGDYAHPMNFALDTSNMGSQYLYIYLRNDAGGREDEDDTCHNVYTQKKYVAGVFCGVGHTPEEAIVNLYSKMKENWAALAEKATDLPKQPLFSEFDEIYPYDLSDKVPWYTLHWNDVKNCDHTNHTSDFGLLGKASVSQELAARRFYDKDRDKYNYAYIGVVRTNKPEAAAYGLLKYYTDKDVAPSTLSIDGAVTSLAGGPVQSKEGQYFLYYSPNQGSTEYLAPITGIVINKEVFVNGMNTALSVNESDRSGGKLPSFSQLRMRSDEQCYIHTTFNANDLPYIEALYIGTGKTKTEAYADLVGTTNAYAATSVNLNYNAYIDQWIAIGYRRTASIKGAIRDVFLYVGDDPPAQFNYAELYSCKKNAKTGKITYSQLKETTVLKNPDGTYVRDEKGKPVSETVKGATYTLLKHNLQSGAETFSLNTGTGGKNIYLYYLVTSATDLDICAEKNAANTLGPIRNIAFSYGDINPAYATAEQLAEVYQDTLHGGETFDASQYVQMSWENVLAVEADSPAAYKGDGTGCFVTSLNYGTLPQYGNSVQHTGDKNVRMYVDRGAGYTPRAAYALGSEGYYSTSTAYGALAIR